MSLNRRKVLIGLSGSLLCLPGIVRTANSSWELADINVKDFGAVGDGQTDDTRAILEASQMSFRRLYFPPGQYLFSDVPLKFKDSIIDASEAELVNMNEGRPLFRVPKGSRVSRSQIIVRSYRGSERSGYFLEISGGLVSDCQIEITQAKISGPVGGIIRHHSQQTRKEFTEGLYFTNIVGHRWDNTSDTPGAPMIDISSGYNSFSACNISVRDIRLLSESLFAKAVCSSRHGAAFSQIKLHDMSIERCNSGFVHFEGTRMTGLVNIGMFDLKEVVTPLIVFKHGSFRRNTQGCYCRDTYRTSAKFSGNGCDLLAAKGSVEVSNYHAIGGMVTRQP